MKSNKLYKLGLLFICTYAIFYLIPKKYYSAPQKNTAEQLGTKTSGAGKALDIWAYERAYPNDNIPAGKFAEAFKKINHDRQNTPHKVPGEWESLGPDFIAGRTLCLAFHPTDENIMYAGSASGGLWKTTTGGVGLDAWHYVPTGFPVLGVSSIAIDQNDPDIIYIGTGEVYGFGFAEPGTTNRVTRGIYGTGVLKTSDGGNTWAQVLPFAENQIVGVSDIVIDPENSQNIFAATTNGVFRSQDGGGNWSMVLSGLDFFDLEIDPGNTNIIYVTMGNLNFGLNPSLSGIFKSTDGGDNFTELMDPGLLPAWSGNARVELDPIDHDIIYASLQAVIGTASSPTTPGGIFKSTDGGMSWTKINNQNVAFFQAWYAHDIAINPNNPDEIMYVGVDAWKSTDTGNNFTKKSNWQGWVFGEIYEDEPGGNANWVHGDIHAVYYHPINNKIYFATDGGVFVSDDGEPPYTSINGGMKTLQLYANMGSSATDPELFTGGAQDNSTYIHKENDRWFRVIGGDGMSAAINSENDSIIYGSYQGLNIAKSTDEGGNYNLAKPTLLPGDGPAFLGPYELAPSDQDIIYGGAGYLYKSIDGGINWGATSSLPVDTPNMVVKIAVSPDNPEVLYVGTSPHPFLGTSTVKIMKSIDGGQNFSIMNGLPNRVVKDIEFDPTDENTVYLTFSGFGSSHVYKTTNGGNDWTAIDNGLPDLPTNTILVDPLNPDNLYVGNDLTVYYSENGGGSWETFSEGLPEAAMIYDLNDSPSNRKIRIATHGHGFFQRDYVNLLSAAGTLEADFPEFKIYPNPASGQAVIEIYAKQNTGKTRVELNNVSGQNMATVFNGNLIEGLNKIELVDLYKYPAGNYFVHVISPHGSLSKQLVVK